MERRRLTQRQARLLDAALMILAASTGPARELLFPATDLRLLHPDLWVCVAVQVVGALTLWWRRDRPEVVALLNAGLNIISPTQASIIAAYSVGAHSRTRGRSVIAFLAVLGGWALGARLWVLEDPLSGPLVLTVLFVIGMYVGAHRALADSLLDRAERAERERVLLAERAVAEERTSLAHEIHDLIASRISLMVLQAGALSVRAVEPALGAAADKLRATGARTLEELHEMVSALRDPDPRQWRGTAPFTAPDVEMLVDEATLSGLGVELTMDSAPPDMAPACARTITRILQEGLANAAKHAPGAPVHVTVAHDDSRTDVTMSNPVPSPARSSDLAGHGTGAGLVGLRERVSLLGGRLDAGLDAGGAFVVRASVPHRPPEDRA